MKPGDMVRAKEDFHVQSLYALGLVVEVDGEGDEHHPVYIKLLVDAYAWQPASWYEVVSADR